MAFRSNDIGLAGTYIRLPCSAPSALIIVEAGDTFCGRAGRAFKGHDQHECGDGLVFFKLRRQASVHLSLAAPASFSGSGSWRILGGVRHAGVAHEFLEPPGIHAPIGLHGASGMPEAVRMYRDSILAFFPAVAIILLMAKRVKACRVRW